MDSRNPIVKLMVAIVDRGNGQKISAILQEEHLPVQVIFLGLGTASSEILDYFGLGETEKDIFICVVPEVKADRLMPFIAEKMHMKKPGSGIIFTIPLSGVSGFICHMLSQKQNCALESEVTKVENCVQHHLIVAVVNQGYTDLVMDAAKKEGATGGTVLHARGVGTGEMEHFLGITIQPEKEVVAILTSRENKQGILQAVNAAAGIKTEAKGILLSLPVDGLMGI